MVRGRGAALPILTLLATLGCDRGEVADRGADPGQDSSSTADVLRELESKSTPAVADTIYVSFRADGPRLGSALDTAVYDAFSEQYPELAMFRQPGEIFATSRFSHGPGRVAYLLRVPSQYSPSATDLWVYDSTKAEFFEPVEVADRFGDGAWYFVEDGWLVDLDGDAVRDVVRRRRDWWIDDATGMAHESDRLLISLWSDDGYLAPTVSFDETLRMRFEIPDWRN